MASLRPGSGRGLRIRDVLATTMVRSLVPLSAARLAARAERGRTQRRIYAARVKKSAATAMEKNQLRLPTAHTRVHARVGGYVRREFLRRISGPLRRRRRGGERRYLGFGNRFRGALTRIAAPARAAARRASSRNNSRPGASGKRDERERESGENSRRRSRRSGRSSFLLHSSRATSWRVSSVRSGSALADGESVNKTRERQDLFLNRGAQPGPRPRRAANRQVRSRIHTWPRKGLEGKGERL